MIRGGGWRLKISGTDGGNLFLAYQTTREVLYTRGYKINMRFCDSLNIRVIPEIDMPGHSAAFRKAIGKDMQTPEGMQVLKEALDEIIPLFKDSLFTLGRMKFILNERVYA